MTVLTLLNLTNLNALLDMFLAECGIPNLRTADELRKIIRSSVSYNGVVVVDDAVIPTCFAWANTVDAIFSDEKNLFVNAVYVKDSERRKGKASEMVKTLRELGKAAGCKNLIFGARHENFSHAADVWNKLGMQPDETHWKGGVDVE